MADTLLQQGGDLMLMGMGTVFVFLATLVAVTTLMSRTVNRLSPEAEVSAASEQTTTAATAPVDRRTIKVIQAALDQHRGRK